MSENNVTLFSSGYRDATIMESVRNHHWCVAQPYHKSRTFTLLYWSFFIGVHTVFDTDERIDCFTLLKSPLNHDIIHTDKKKTTKIHIKTRNILRIIFPVDFSVFLCGMFFLGEERLDALNSLFLDIIHKNQKWIKFRIIIMIIYYLMEQFLMKFQELFHYHLVNF